MASVTVRVPEELRFFLPVGRRHGEVRTATDGDATLLHVVESLGVPRTEIGALRVGGRRAGPDRRPRDGDVVEVLPVALPQRVADPRFVVDVHLVLDRFDPPLAPWTRCPACNGALAPADAESVRHRLQPGTRRSYTRFSQCVDCGRPYWRGAHARRLEEIVAEALGDPPPG